MNHDHFEDEDQRDKFCALYEQLMNGDCSADDVVPYPAIDELMQNVANCMDKKKTKSCTRHLWICYIEQVPLLKMFLYAERAGDWTPHLQCISRMIPYFHAADHLAYAKAARLNVQQTKLLGATMSPEEYKQFSENDRFTLRRSDRFWG